MCRGFINQDFNHTYSELVEKLLVKYGPVNDSYFKYTKDRRSCYKNKNLIYTEGVSEIHHIREDIVPLLSKKEMGMIFPQFQTADQLVYSNTIEHTVMHYLIYKETGYSKLLGIGGILNFLMGLSETYFKEEWRQDYLTMLAKIAINSRSVEVSKMRWKAEELFEKVFKKELIQDTASDIGQQLRLDELIATHNYIVENFEVGITKLTLEEYKNTIGSVCGWQTKFTSDFYILRTSVNNTAIAYKTKNGGLSLIKGRTFSKCNFKSVNELYKHLDEIMTITQDFNARVLSVLKPISDYIKSIGGSGRIHGLIVDINYINHIGLDNNFNLIAYTSTESDWYNNHTIHIAHTPLILIESTLSHNSTVNLPQTIENKLNLITPHSNTTIQCKTGFDSYGVDFYRLSRKVFDTQKTGEFKHLVSLPENMNESYEWSNLPQIDYYIDMIEA